MCREMPCSTTIVNDAWKGRFVLQAKLNSETKRVRYLLGLSSPAERAHIESEYFEDDDAFQEMLTAEDDLIDAYARGELAGEERLSFQKRFVRSFPGRDRVQFARAFASAVCDTRPIENQLPATFFKTFQSPRLLRIAAAIVLVAVLAGLISDRKRMTNELREARAESAELGKRIEALQQSSDDKRTRTAEVAAQPAGLQAQPDKPTHGERVTIATQQVRHLPEEKNDPEKFALRKPEPAETLINTQDATPGNTFEPKRITELPLDARNVPSLLTLQPGLIHVPESAADQCSIHPDAILPSLNTWVLLPWDNSSVRIPNSRSWFRFRIALNTAAIHEDYRITIKTSDGRPVTSVDWIEPLTPHQTFIDTPAISTSDLPLGDYVLFLMGKEPEGSFIKVAEYAFKVVKY